MELALNEIDISGLRIFAKITDDGGIVNIPKNII